jgi:hypothetical protein
VADVIGNHGNNIFGCASEPLLNENLIEQDQKPINMIAELKKAQS